MYSSSLRRNDLAEHYYNFIWSVLQTRKASWAWIALGDQPYHRVQKALVTMFDVPTWFPQAKEPMTCLKAIADGIACSKCDWETRRHLSSLLEDDIYKSSLMDVGSCNQHVGPYFRIVNILAEGFISIYIDPGPKAAVSAIPIFWDRIDYDGAIGPPQLMPWVAWIGLEDRMEWFGSRPNVIEATPLPRWNGSSVLYPTILDQLEIPAVFHVQYQLTDGCFMMNGRQFEQLKAGAGPHTGEGSSNAERLDCITPLHLGPSKPIGLIVTKSYLTLKV